MPTEEQEAELRALEAMSPDDVDTSDMPEVTDWSNAVQGRYHDPDPARLVALRLDPDVAPFFRQNRPLLEATVNRLLREHLRAMARPLFATDPTIR